MRRALVLSGGGVRGTAHIALLERLEELGMEFEIVVGASAGAIVGGLYCLHVDATLVKNELFSAIDEFLTYFTATFPKDWGVTTVLEGFIQRSAVSLEDYYPFFRKLFGRKTFSDCRLEFRVPVFNLQTMSTDIVESGYLVDAVLSSSSVPGFFEPNWLAGYPVSDGGVLDNVPVSLARNLGADYVLASAFDIWFEPLEDPILNVLGREDELRERILQEAELSSADDFVVHNLKVEWNDFNAYREVYETAKRDLAEWVPSKAVEMGILEGRIP